MCSSDLYLPMAFASPVTLTYKVSAAQGRASVSSPKEGYVVPVVEHPREVPPQELNTSMVVPATDPHVVPEVVKRTAEIPAGLMYLNQLSFVSAAQLMAVPAVAKWLDQVKLVQEEVMVPRSFALAQSSNAT